MKTSYKVLIIICSIFIFLLLGTLFAIAYFGYRPPNYLALVLFGAATGIPSATLLMMHIGDYVVKK